MASNAWDGQDQHMASGHDDEFNQFLDMSGMNNMQFDFQNFQGGNQPGDAIMSNSPISNMIARTDSMAEQSSAAIAMTTAQTHQGMTATHIMAPGAPGEAISNIDAQIQYLQQQKFQQQQRQMHEQQQAAFFSNSNSAVPPTPQSLEMAAGNAQFYSPVEQRDRNGYDRNYNRSGEQNDMAFTPLVSPAVTPLDPHFNIDNAFTVPGSYFSPLTSPALVPQHDGLQGYDAGTNSHNSPIDMELESPIASGSIQNTQDLAKKVRKNNAAKARSKTNVKNSPITKPMRKKTGPSPAIVSQILSEADERNLKMDMSGGSLPLPANSTEGSEDASVSPENLSDMPPPPVPARRSNSKSPYIAAQNGSGPAPPMMLNDERQPHPATPASLMKLPASKNKQPIANQMETNTATEHIESLELPESVSNQPLVPSHARILPQSPSIEQSSSMGPMHAHLASPGIRTPGTHSANQSPSLGPRSTGPQARRTPQLLARNSRKRSSSVQVSPALLPRISPNIKPLIPGTPGMSAEDTSRLLMSKSNYQNILEGNTVPGVSYPSELSTNLTSKRTSHKIAEQGRRNRINSALQIMAGLLPDKQSVGSGEDAGDDKKDSKQANAQSSKASVVENAIVHMKNLQEENSSLKKELQELKEKLGNMTASSS